MATLNTADGTSGDVEYHYVQQEHANDKVNFGTAATTRLSIDSEESAYKYDFNISFRRVFTSRL